MEDVAFNEWPDFGSGANSWLPAYGFQTPTALLDRDDFIGNPDAEYFLHGTSTPCLYLETIHEETSDDLRSDSDISTRESPLGWFASDSETDSVICMDTNNDTDCESERELACPIKRRRQEVVLPSEEDYQSLSRSSSLLQFETLEKQCQETSSSSPSIFSVESYTKAGKTPGGGGSESGDSDTTLVSKSCSLDNLSKSPSKKISAENLSEDSGYSDHMLKKSSRSRFSAYDYCDFGKIGGKFGASCQNLNLVVGEWVNLEKECEVKFRSTSASEPNLVQDDDHSLRRSGDVVLSVPKDLDLVGLEDATKKTSIAAKNWDLGDFAKKINEMANFKREGSYSEAMRNRVDLSDDETSLCYKKKIPKSTIGEFDKKVLQVISESIHSIADAHLSDIYDTPPPIQQSSKRNVVSTPNLVMNVLEQERFIGMIEEERRKSVQDLPRKSSLANHSTSTSCVSEDVEEKTLNYESGSTKEVHFSPVVSEVNWPDNFSTPSTVERESSYSLSSISPDRDLDTLAKSLLDRNPTPPRRTGSQPDLPRNPRGFRSSFSQSQPDVSRLRRRGSQLIKKDLDGCIIKAYVDGDGVQYKHTHLDVEEPSSQSPSTSTTGHVLLQRDVERKQAVEGMEAVQTERKTKKKLGGFFSRLTSFRFSTRKDDKKKKKEERERKTEYVMVQSPQNQRVATKADYIYIPLKGGGGGPSVAAAAAAAESPVVASSKPPLPRAPPRVIGASVKSKGENAHHRRPVHHHDPEHRRRKTIDSCPRPMEPMGLIETDLDTEVTVITSGTNVKTRSLLNLGAEPRLGHLLGVGGDDTRDNNAEAPPTRPHKSMEFLLDKQNLKVVEPPENELQKSDRVMSEHQLRVQRSLQKLTVPEWYKQNQVPQGFLLKKPSSSSRESRWTGTGSKTTSLSSLGSNSGTSPVILSPTTQPFVRWSTSKLNSTASSPCASIRSSFNTRHQPNGSLSPSSIRSSFSYRQPYLGWRSQERLSKPRTPAERLANSLLLSSSQPPQASPDEIQTSIKEVTSAIVHYVSGLKPESSGDETRSRSTSPRGSQKLCWLESSFVGIKPLDSPQTPQPPTSLRLELQTHNDVSLLNAESVPKPSPGSTTLEDVLDSLLGLPSSDRAPSPSLQVTASANTSPKKQQQHPRRRSSEGSQTNNNNSRRVSFESPLLQCRYSRCGKTIPKLNPEASNWKNCHNCSYIYCSRSCRRAHWEKHRKTCLFSRIGTLCRQVIASIKEQKETLNHLSLIARRGYLSHGLGAVKCFFPGPDKAEKFLTGGLSDLGELTYVRWPDLLPSEMGPQLYSELVQMCKTYNPDSKMVLYVAVCVVSETPATGAVKWERQLVSRCAKMRLSKDFSIPEKEDNPETLILTCSSIKGGNDEAKKLSIDNVLKELRARGVSLKRQHPIIFKQLCAYADGMCEKFTPITVYPKDATTGKSFMCIIMLEADPESLRQVELAGVKVRTVDVLCAD